MPKIRPAAPRALLATAALAALAVPALAFRLRADRNRASERELQRLEQQWSSAFNSGNRSQLQRLLAEGFIFTSSQGQVSNKAGYVDFVVNHIHVVSGGIGEMVIRIYGDTGVVSAKWTGVETIDGEEFNGAFRFTDVWVRRNGRWFSISSQDSVIPP